MLATDGVQSEPTCIAASSPSGEIKLGNTTATTGDTNLQLGGVVSSEGVVDPLIAPAGGALVSEPVEVPGGLLGLMCPSDIPLVTALCETITSSELNRVTATVAPAGQPTDFNVIAGISEGVPILTLPVKVNLDHPLLAPNCSIGSESDPILLRPENTVLDDVFFVRGDLDGTLNPQGRISRIDTVGTQGDDTFAVPGAQNCGLLGLINLAINAQQGLPSPSGNNHLVLDDAESHVMTKNTAEPLTGQQFSDGWHAALQP